MFIESQSQSLDKSERKQTPCPLSPTVNPSKTTKGKDTDKCTGAPLPHCPHKPIIQRAFCARDIIIPPK